MRPTFPWASAPAVRPTDFAYPLPLGLIAQTPAPQRDQSRLLVVHRAERRFEHRRFSDLLEYLRPGDAVVLNDSRVIPARLRGVKPSTGGHVETLLVEEQARNEWWVRLRPGRRVRAGTRLVFLPGTASGESADTAVISGTGAAGAGRSLAVLMATVLAKDADGRCLLRFTGIEDLRAALEDYGEVPLPPYVERAEGPTVEDRERYQTVFARRPGSVAAPTAGLHFTEALLVRLRVQGVRVCFVTLHVGSATFAPVKAGRVEDHVMHEEMFELPAAAAAAVNAAKREGRRVLAVGTTTTRVLETVAAGTLCGEGKTTGRVVAARVLGPGDSTPPPLRPCRGRTRAFIYPPFCFRIVNGLLTNFHLPQSTLLMLVSAFAAPGETRGRDLALAAYAEAARERYRFYSYGDAMLLL